MILTLSIVFIFTVCVTVTCEQALGAFAHRIVGFVGEADLELNFPE